MDFGLEDKNTNARAQWNNQRAKTGLEGRVIRIVTGISTTVEVCRAQVITLVELPLGNYKMPADEYRYTRVPGCYGEFLLVTTLTSRTGEWIYRGDI